MQAIPATSPTSGATAPPAAGDDTSATATNAFGLGFDALLKIILTQLNYQDPLKPMDNFEFVSQLAQFSQVQQGQVANERLAALVSAQATDHATGLLGRRVDVSTSPVILSGIVTAVTLSNGAPTVTLKTDDDRTVSGVAIGSISQVREKN